MSTFEYDAAVVGLGYVGLALAQGACAAGMRLVGYEIKSRVVDDLNAGLSHIDDLSDQDVRAMLAAGFTASSDPAVLGEAAVVVVCAPTPLSADGGPDLAPVRSASWAIARHLRPGTLVVIESTSYPGTTEEVVLPILEEGSGLVAGRDFHLAFSPERIDPGNTRYGLATTPKIVGGLTPACTAAASRFYRRVVREVVLAKGTREAELAKIIENTYRHVNIALVNEMAILAHELDIDLWNAIDCAATKPFGFQTFYPGPGPGGHCIPIDPNYFAFKVRSEGAVFQLVETADRINSRMPRYVVERAAATLNRLGRSVNGASVLLLGVTYKPNIADQRGAPAQGIARALRAMGAELAYHDPYVPDWSVDGERVTRRTEFAEAIGAADLTILLQDHTVYDLGELAQGCRMLLDTRGRTNRLRGENVEVL